MEENFKNRMEKLAKKVAEKEKNTNAQEKMNRAFERRTAGSYKYGSPSVSREDER